MRKRIGYVVVIAMVLVSTSAFSAETWIRTYGDGVRDIAGDFLILDDGGFLVVGESSSAAKVCRLSAEGDVIWDREYGDQLRGSAASIVATADGFVIGGSIQAEGRLDMDAYLLKIDSDGEEIWSRTFGTSLNEHGCQVLIADDGGFILVANCEDPSDVVADQRAAGYGGFAGRSNTYLARTDAIGNQVWARRYETDDNVITSAAAMSPTGEIVVLSSILHYPLDDNDILLCALDANGDELWSRSWIEGSASGYDLVSTSDGGYVICGIQSFPEDPTRIKADALVMKTDEAGHESWSKTYGMPDMEETAFVVTETQDGNYVCAGWQSTSLYARTDDILLATFARDGTPLSETVIPSTAHNMHERIRQHPDGSYVIAGSASESGHPFRIQLIKVGP